MDIALHGATFTFQASQALTKLLKHKWMARLGDLRI